MWRAIPHESAYKHATGEAVYCDDIPGFKNELFLELVWSKRAHAFLKKVDVSKSLEIEGVVGFISHEDLKDKNMFGIIVKDEEIFASEKVRCVGQLIGALVATTPSKAKLAAELVDIQYIDCHPRILTISVNNTYDTEFAGIFFLPLNILKFLRLLYFRTLLATSPSLMSIALP